MSNATTMEAPVTTLVPVSNDTDTLTIQVIGNGKPAKTKKSKGKGGKGKPAASKGKGAKPAPVEAKVRTSNGLTPTQQAILKVLVKGPASKKTLGAPAKILGAATRDGNGVQGGGLIGAGLIRATEPQKEGQGRCWYVITAAGTKALAKATA